MENPDKDPLRSEFHLTPITIDNNKKSSSFHPQEVLKCVLHSIEFRNFGESSSESTNALIAMTLGTTVKYVQYTETRKKVKREIT